MASLATQADAVRLGYTLKAGKEEEMLARASARLRRAAGKQISSLTSTIRCDVENGRIILPCTPVTAVSTVAHTADDGGATITGWRWNGYDRIDNVWVCGTSSTGWPDFWPTQANVTLTHGLVTIPDELVELVCSVAQRLGTADEATGMEAGIRSESIDDYSVTYAAEAREDAGSLLPGEEKQLARILGIPTAFVVRSK